MSESERCKLSNISANHHSHIKFKTLRAEFLPYIGKSSSPEVRMETFTKKSFENGWRSKAELKRDMTRLHQQQIDQKNSEFSRLKEHLKNESSFLHMKRQNLTRRLQTNLLIRAVMKELASNQEYMLNRNKLFQEM